MFQIEVLWNGKWRKLFTGTYSELAEYQKQCVNVETRIVPVEKEMNNKYHQISINTIKYH